ncbi:PREDICTED: activating signal cointegrator 1 complex subunit 1-like, partial [Tauraco erythrolophus]|uniref:activating signal cointegrator 1 complex subunit 1-like n=1 Tax=Tauraco erythrolophus TaxID=121530 RepID=UPI00052315D4
RIAGGKPLTVEVAGVEYMNDDPAMTDVLYAKVHMKDGSDRLQVIADQLVERFVASGLMLKEWDRVKLHATVMNTLFRNDPSAEERNNTMTGKSSFKERESFNSRNILKLFENFYFGEVQLDSVRLSQRFSSDASGYYLKRYLANLISCPKNQTWELLTWPPAVPPATGRGDPPRKATRWVFNNSHQEAERYGT